MTLTVKGWTIGAIALASFAAGGLVAARMVHLNQVQADSTRVFELRIYHAVPGKAPALQDEFRTKVTKLFAKHDLKAVGYWAPLDAPDSQNTFIYILAHPSRDAAKAHWDAFRADPEFQAMMKEQQAPEAKLVEKVDSTYMAPTDFSPMK